jgi:hypothetical protein
VIGSSEEIYLLTVRVYRKILSVSNVAKEKATDSRKCRQGTSIHVHLMKKKLYQMSAGREPYNISFLTMDHSGVVTGLRDIKFQSNVGNGLRPNPLTVPVIMASLTLLGAIHVVQLGDSNQNW